MQSAKKRVLYAHIGGETLHRASIVAPQIAVLYGRDEREQSVRVLLIAARRRFFDMDGDPVATVLSVNISVYD